MKKHNARQKYDLIAKFWAKEIENKRPNEFKMQTLSLRKKSVISSKWRYWLVSAFEASSVTLDEYTDTLVCLKNGFTRRTTRSGREETRNVQNSLWCSRKFRNYEKQADHSQTNFHHKLFLPQAILVTS